MNKSSKEIIPEPPGGRLDADQASRRLGVRRDTLYAYVSRGLIRSETQRGTRARLYHAEDVDLLVQRKQGRRDPGQVAAEALHWGAPLLESGLTLIRDGRLFYRGVAAEAFLGESSFEQVEALFDEVERPERARAVLEARLRRGERIPGFGHSLYPEGDPRATSLLARLHAQTKSSRALATTDAIEAECLRLIARKPNVDFATVGMRRTLGMPAGSALALVAIARTAGWIAHAIEQYATGRLIRPRARYTGDTP